MAKKNQESEIADYDRWAEIRKMGAVNYALKIGVPVVGLSVFLISYFTIKNEGFLSPTTLFLLLISGAFGFVIGLLAFWGMERRFEISTEHDKIQSELSIIGAEIEAVNDNDALSEQEKSELYEELDKKMQSLLNKMD